jgi:cytidine deaminase
MLALNASPFNVVNTQISSLPHAFAFEKKNAVKPCLWCKKLLQEHTSIELTREKRAQPASQRI